MVASIFTTLIGSLGNYMVEPIKRSLADLVCSNTYTRKLRDEIKTWEAQILGMEMQVNSATDNAEIIDPEVESWLTSAKQIRDKANAIATEAANVQSGSLAIKSRHALGRNARQTIAAIKDLRERCKFNRVSHPVSIVIGPILLEPMDEFVSQKHIEKEILTALRGKSTMRMGICGMAGVGKTTMVQRIVNKMMEEDLFGEIVMVQVSQQIDMSKIQLEVAEWLGLKLEKESLSVRAKILHERLINKKMLIVLDDIWETLNLTDLGISPDCTIIITSRSKAVLNEMDVQKTFEIPVLNEAEAWILFKKKVGNCLQGLDLYQTAIEVAKECKGLPIALVTVGGVLKNMKDICIWKDALQQLRTSNPVDIPDVVSKVYSSLKLSWDFIANQHAKSMFLVCCLFPEGFDIPIELLTWYGVGLRLFKGTRCMEEAKNRTYTLVHMLKSWFLLLDGRDQHHVKMHDVVRDTGIFFGLEEGLINHSENLLATQPWISLNLKKSVGFPVGFNYPNLHLLLIKDDRLVYGELDDLFFQGMEELKVLSLSSLHDNSLPHTMKLLRSLRTLHIVGCKVECISVVGALINLEILIFSGCGKIKELPAEIGYLNELKFLKILNCPELKIIVAGVISHLIELEELCIRRSFRGWETTTEGEETKNAAVGELKCLSKLRVLDIEIEDGSLAKEIHVPSLIVKQITTSQPMGSTSREKEDGKDQDGCEIEEEICSTN